MAAQKTQQAALSFLDFVNSSPTPFHAVRTAKEQLSKAGFQEIKVQLADFLPSYLQLM
jgi:aspartyl aminopeptidase